MLPAEQRLPEARKLIAQKQYFVLHAPRQSGKTTTLAALARSLTDEGSYAALLVSCESGRAAGEGYPAAQRAILNDIRFAADNDLPLELRPPAWPEAPEGLLLAALAQWARACPRPLVLFFDEIDALVGDSLISVLTQLRAGFRSRPEAFPSSVVLCGLRDVREYKAAAGGDPSRLGTASPFNIKDESMRLGDFSLEEVRELYGQHTAEAGQEFTDEALERVYAATQGQPWLVNRLAREITMWMEIDPPEPITGEHVEIARERLILSRATHLDSLVARLHEERVRHIIEPMIAGTMPDLDIDYNDDVSYLRDLGLIALWKPLRIANPIYREVIVRVLGSRTEDLIQSDPDDFVGPDGRLDMRALLEDFTGFWRTFGEALKSSSSYPEAATQLIMMAYYHRMINGTGRVHREYGLGRGRVDLLIRWPFSGPDGRREWQEEAIELKTWRQTSPGDPLDEGLSQLDAYLDQLGLGHGTLVIFDERPDAPKISERISFADEHTPSGRAVTVLRA